MKLNSRKIKKLILKNFPYAIFAYAGNKISFAYRIAEGKSIDEKIVPFMDNIGASFAKIVPSFHPVDIVVGIAVGAGMALIMYIKSKNKKKFRYGEEYGSAKWGSEINPHNLKHTTLCYIKLLK